MWSMSDSCVSWRPRSRLKPKPKPRLRRMLLSRNKHLTEENEGGEALDLKSLVGNAVVMNSFSLLYPNLAMEAMFNIEDIVFPAMITSPKRPGVSFTSLNPSQKYSVFCIDLIRFRSVEYCYVIQASQFDRNLCQELQSLRSNRALSILPSKARTTAEIAVLERLHRTNRRSV